MLKKIWLLIAVVFTVFTLSACEGDEGKEFVGHWFQEDKPKYPADINITYEEGVFHIDENSASIGVRSMEYSVTKREAKAESNSVLVGQNFSMRLEHGKLQYNGHSYVKK